MRFSKEEEEDVAKCRATTKQPRTQKQVDSKGKDHQAAPERRNKSTAKEKTTKAAANAEIASIGNTTKQPPKQKHVDSKRKTTIARCDGGIRKRDSPTAPIRATS